MTVEGFSRWVRRLAPWVLAAVVIALLLSRYSPRAIADELARGAVLAMVPWVLTISLGALVLMALADWLVFAAALGVRHDRAHHLHVLDVVRGRAATGILMSLHHGLSSGGYVVWLGRRTGVGAGATVGAATYQMLSDLGAVCLIALPSAIFGGALLPARVGASAAAVAVCGLVGVSALLLFGPRVTPRRWRESRLVAAWTRVPPSVWAASTILRAATIALNIVGTWAAARAFGLAIPFQALAAGLPIAYLVAALPINVFGLGAVQAAWVVLFERHAPGAQILAFQFVFQLLSAAAQVARGLPFLPGVLRDLESGASERPSHEPEGMILP